MLLVNHDLTYIDKETVFYTLFNIYNYIIKERNIYFCIFASLIPFKYSERTEEIIFFSYPNQFSNAIIFGSLHNLVHPI